MPQLTQSLSARLGSKLRSNGLRFASRRSADGAAGKTGTDRQTLQHEAVPQPTPLSGWAQEQSPLFKLPPEIRNQIYDELFGREICHVVSWESGLGHYCCRGVRGGNPDLDAPCWGHVWCDDLPDEEAERRPNKSALLRTCKRM